MKRNFDVVVIGTGSAALTVASRCRAAGREIAVVDSRPFGGTCALRGCDPKKVLVGAAEVIDWNRRMRAKGVSAEQTSINWPELMRFKRAMIERVPKMREESFSKSGIAAFRGRGRFISANAVQVDSDVLEARNLVVAAGAKPVDLNIPGVENVTTSEQFLELNELPARIVFIGGGYISFEFAHVAARAGARVTILHRGPRPLVRFDPDLVGQLVERTRRVGIDVQVQAQVAAITGRPGDLRVKCSIGGREQEFDADLVVHGAGRVPEIDDLALDQAGVQWDPHRGIQVNEYLQSISNPTVYAAGDAAASEGPPLTPIAGYEGQIVADNLIEGNHRKPNYEGVASVVFTVPPLASVGLQEATAHERGLKFRVNHQETGSWYSSRRVGEEYSGFKLLIEETSGRVLGAHVLGPQAEETINLFALAIRKGLTAAELKDNLFAYPTHGSDVQYML
jgi:glutathione reductase (NADPH)